MGRGLENWAKKGLGMKIVNLIRVDTSDLGTFGVFSCDGAPICLSVELPWRNNEPNISCIPDGQYLCDPLSHARFGRCFYVKDKNGEPTFGGRSEILIHPANLPKEIRGCIAPGTSFGVVNGALGVLSSGKALAKLADFVGFKRFSLFIWNNWN